MLFQIWKHVVKFELRFPHFSFDNKRKMWKDLIQMFLHKSINFMKKRFQGFSIFFVDNYQYHEEKENTGIKNYFIHTVKHFL